MLDGICPDDNQNFCTVPKLLQHAKLVIRKKTGKYTRSVIIVKELTAEFKIQFFKLGHALTDMLRLQLSVLFRIKSYMICHCHSSCAMPSDPPQRQIRTGIRIFNTISLCHVIIRK